MDIAEMIVRLETRAEHAGLSMAEVCRRANVAPSTPSRWKAGTFEPRMRTYRRLEAVVSEAENERALVIAEGR